MSRGKISVYEEDIRLQLEDVIADLAIRGYNPYHVAQQMGYLRWRVLDSAAAATSPDNAVSRFRVAFMRKDD